VFGNPDETLALVFEILHPDQESHEIELWVVESHEKVIYLPRMKRQKIKS